MSRDKIHPVILCGGIGARLWPLSRPQCPKQFLRLFSRYSFLQNTLNRTHNHHGFTKPLLLCSADYIDRTRQECDSIGVHPGALICEPIRNNTAPAIALAALYYLEQGHDAVMAIMPSDHIIGDNDIFIEALIHAHETAASGRIVTLGIAPDVPNTNYGYIHADNTAAITHFIEKPDKHHAKELIDSGNYFWNSGIVIIKSSTYISELSIHRPDILSACQNALDKAHRYILSGTAYIAPSAADFRQCPSLSVDYAIMEHTDKAVMLPLGCEWDDIGSWKAIWNIIWHKITGQKITRSK